MSVPPTAREHTAAQVRRGASQRPGQGLAVTAVVAAGAGMTAQAVTGIAPAQLADGAVAIDFLARVAMHSAYSISVASSAVLVAVTTVARRHKRPLPSSPSSFKESP